MQSTLKSLSGKPAVSKFHLSELSLSHDGKNALQLCEIFLGTIHKLDGKSSTGVVESGE